ncbi:hypothetical protein DFH09DRAFT_1319880 [Mycena vulgaris]|nr:hypothetical protein DFH09DRAFT_1319880 [Mycena vulgaris]
MDAQPPPADPPAHPPASLTAPPAATLSSGAADGGLRPIWEKCKAADLKARGLQEDPIFAFMINTLYPQFKKAVDDNTIGQNRKTYTCDILFPIIDKEFDISGPSGYNVGSFKDKLYTALKNRFGQEGKTKTPAPAGKKTSAPRAKNPTDLFREKHKEDIAAATKTELDGVPREHKDGRYLSQFNANAKKMYEQSDPEVKQAFEAEAEALKAKIEAGPTPEDIAQNQETVYHAVNQQLRGLMGESWGGHGDMAFYVRGAFKNKEGKVKRFYLSVGPKKTVAPFIPSRGDDEKGEFHRWAVSVLTATADEEPQVQVDDNGKRWLPDVDVADLSAAKIIALIKAYTGSSYKPTLVLPRGEGKTEAMDIDVVPEEELRDFFASLLEVQRVGGKPEIATKVLGHCVEEPSGEKKNDDGDFSPERAKRDGAPAPPPLPPAGNALAPPPPPPGGTLAPPDGGALIAPAGDALAPPPPPPPAKKGRGRPPKSKSGTAAASGEAPKGKKRKARDTTDTDEAPQSKKARGSAPQGGAPLRRSVRGAVPPQPAPQPQRFVVKSGKNWEVIAEPI